MADADSDTELELKQIELEQDFERKQQAVQLAFEKKQFELEQRKLLLLAKQKKRAHVPSDAAIVVETVGRSDAPSRRAISPRRETTSETLETQARPRDRVKQEPGPVFVDLTTPPPASPALQTRENHIKTENRTAPKRDDADDPDIADDARQTPEGLIPPPHLLKRRRTNRPVLESDDEETTSENSLIPGGADEDILQSSPVTLPIVTNRLETSGRGAPAEARVPRPGVRPAHGRGDDVPTIRPTVKGRYYCRKGHSQAAWDGYSQRWQRRLSRVHHMENDVYGRTADTPCIPCRTNNKTCRVLKIERQLADIPAVDRCCARCLFYKRGCEKEEEA